MKKSKKVSDIYRKKFKDVEITPPEDVWQNISNSLPERERRKKILPIWYAVGGAAATLLFFLLFQNDKGVSLGRDYNQIVAKEEATQQLDVDPMSDFYQKTFSEASGLLEKLMHQPVNSSTLANSEEDVNGDLEIDESEKKEVEPLNQLEQGKLFGSTAEVALLSQPESLHPNPDEIQDVVPTSTSGNEFVENDMQDEQEIATEQKSPLANRFSVTTSAAAVYFNNTGGGNTFAQEIPNNNGDGEVSVAYGVNLSYQVSEKIRIRTGITKMELSHNTSNLPNSSVASSAGIRATENSANSAILAAPVIGYLHQTMDFIEVPMEVEYSVIQQKVGLNLIGGISTLFLNDNMISLNSPVATTILGAGDNLNNLSFSTNIGLGINYLILPQVRLNLEPMFKYQLNTFNNPDELNPYYFGIYTGLNYRF